MNEPDPHRHHEPERRTLHEHAAHPDQTVDALEEQVLGRRVEPARDDDDEAAPASGRDPDDPTDAHGTVERGPGAEPP
jgi:hypothetical protein